MCGTVDGDVRIVRIVVIGITTGISLLALAGASCHMVEDYRDIEMGRAGCSQQVEQVVGSSTTYTLWVCGGSHDAHS